MIARRVFLQGAAALVATPSFGSTSSQGYKAIDTHAHVFRHDLPVAERRRYSVDYDATPNDYLAMLHDNGMARGVLIQPSFLGFDNSYLLAVIARNRGMLRGIIALPRDTQPAEMARLKQAGISGIRLNLIGRSDPDLGGTEWRAHLDAVAALGWQVEVQCEAARLPKLMPALLASGTPVVIDHFGRPDAALGIEDPGFAYLLTTADSGRVYVKLSAPYRVGLTIADAAAPLLLKAFGPDHLLWGSDWPHTQFETQADARTCRRALDHWVPDAAMRATILSTTPSRLFGFDTPKVR